MFFKKALAVTLSVATAFGMQTATDTETYAAEDDYVYVTMNVPYDDFYDAYDITDSSVWEVEDGVDAVSTATTSKFKGTTGLAKGTYNNDKYIMGVAIPVAVKKSDIDKVVADENQDYAYTTLETKPAYYSVLTIDEEEDYQFSRIQDTEYNTDKLSINNLSTSAGYGDYQIDLTGFKTAADKGMQISEDEYVPYTIYGVIINTEEGESMGMTMLENIWVASKHEDAQVAWSTLYGQCLKRAHGSGDPFYQFDCNGQNIDSVTVITNVGTVNVAADIKLPEYYSKDTSSLKATLTNDLSTMEITGIPSDLKDVTVTVSGGLATGASVVDGLVALSSAPAYGTNYTITVSSSNYVDIKITASTRIADPQKAELNKWIAKGEAAANESLDSLIADAKAMVADANTSSYDAASMITKLMAAVKNTYDSFTLTATGKDSTVTLELGAEISSMVNPTYTISKSMGRGSSVVASGELTSNVITLDKPLEASGAYTVNIVSENYKDVTASLSMETEEPTTGNIEETTSNTNEETTSVVEETSAVETTKAAETTKATETTTKKTTKVGSTAIKKVSPKKMSAKKISLVVKKVNGVSGYETRVFTSSKSAKANKKVLVKKVSKKQNVTITSKKLKNKKNLFVTVAAYKVVAGKKVYGAWTKPKKVTVKSEKH